MTLPSNLEQSVDDLALALAARLARHLVPEVRLAEQVGGNSRGEMAQRRHQLLANVSSGAKSY
jgi:hypothetical protein